MKIIADFFPILLFFISYKWGGIYAATEVAILASIVQVLYLRFKEGRFSPIPLATLGILIFFGGATLIFRNELFIKWKPTALYWILACAFLFSQYFGTHPFVQRMLQSSVQLPREVWQRLNVSWVIFFLLMGALNLYVVYHFDTATWVNFKLFGTLILTFIFVLLQAFYIASRVKKHESL